MLFKGHSLSVTELEAGIYDLVFNCENDVVNKLDPVRLAELGKALGLIKQQKGLQGLMLSSAKESFIAGADVAQFMGLFQSSEEVIAGALLEMHQVFNLLEDLPCPTVCAINGAALGGGFEVCLAADYRVADEKAKLGQPEVKLGIFPGWGGTVRLPRLIGVDNANEWICGGKEYKAEDALRVGAIDAVVDSRSLKDAALDLLKGCINGQFDYKARRAEKTSPIPLVTMEMMMAFESAKAVIYKQAGPHYPAPLAALKVMQKHVLEHREKAQQIEALGFAQIAKTDVCSALVGLFLKDHHIRKAIKAHALKAKPTDKMAVLGAGIMGGGISYQAASRGTPVLMKDINEDALQLGLDEATKVLTSRLNSGRINSQSMAATLNKILPTLNYEGFHEVDLVVEAVVENAAVKQQVLSDVESVLTENAILTSNTSTISIDVLSEGLKRPENFCGMHFFNPVHRMPLVEVIRGRYSSDQTIATVVALAHKMGKTPIVVNDCPGFLINRILFAYFIGFNQMLEEGADFQEIDRTMERFGWPMGPAYLLDVVGIDTAFHAAQELAAGFPERMLFPEGNAINRMYQNGRLGQKNGRGFYQYEVGKRGKLQKVFDEESAALFVNPNILQREFSPEEVIERMMIPLCLEAVRCLEEGVVSSAAEVDMGLIMGIGFPMFKGGALHYIDSMGIANFCKLSEKYTHLGALYQPTEKMKEMAQTGELFFSRIGGDNETA
jgi:3-hydroxyacyl-CoA dehydrogenase/enoyl-CoA hydratase/3-hydroxybutyryl-CoA epimerase/enoyl-CoA isomerase